ncbi:MAG TPA: pyridoxamine 5'-phosphate oxidase family protein [Streptomyces sp.]|nr:pyridoxamine 5'-phosphate oxidase family protein [Streptomyces sp.]
MDPLPTPEASPPVMFGAPAPPGDLLPWTWAEQRLTTAKNYWIATTRPGGRPHCRPVWGVWLSGGFWFSTGSLAARNLPLNDEITVHLEDGQEVVIVEGTARKARLETDHDALRDMCGTYSSKYDYPVTPVGGEVRDSNGVGGPALRVAPRAVFGWDRDMTSPTKWTFNR